MKPPVILEYPPPGAGPATQREGKFVQFRWHGREYLVFAPRERHRFHNQILGEFLAEHRLPHRWSSEQTLAIETPELVVLGGGRYRVNTEAGTLALWDSSQAYGRFDDRGLAARIAAAAHPWSAYAVKIGQAFPGMSLEHDIAARFDLDGDVLDVRPYGHGLINDSFVVTTTAGRRAILQRINRHVFPRPEWIMENLRTLVDHVQRLEPAPGARDLRLPRILVTRDGEDYVIDRDGGFWRALGFIENTRSFETVTNTAQAEEVGFALGRFHALVHDLDPARLHRTLPGFHDTPGYFRRFLRACARPRIVAASRELLYCLAFVEARWDLTRVLETARRDGRLALRVIHGDTKLNNFLFDAASGRAISLIDLDTVQPGLIHYDIGDCLRSCANPAGESPAELGAVRFDLAIGRALLKSYVAETRQFLTPEDYRWLYSAIRLVPFELGLRFLTDFLEGDRYFKIERPGQNLYRARVQFALLADIERQEADIKALVAELETTARSRR
jgi:Ser/Thr protein kinase RdoA (MazF antagonist)